MHLGFAAAAAFSLLAQLNPRLWRTAISGDTKTRLQARLRSTLCFGRRRADGHQTSCAGFFVSPAAWLNSYINRNPTHPNVGNLDFHCFQFQD